MNVTEYTPFHDPESLYVLNEELLAAEDLKGINLLMSITGFSDAGHVVNQITVDDETERHALVALHRMLDLPGKSHRD